MKKMSCFFLICSTFIFLILGCEKISPDINDNEYWDTEFGKFMNNKTDGTFFVQCSTSVASQENSGNTVIGGNFTGNDKTGNATIGGIDVLDSKGKKSNIKPDDLWGTITFFQIHPSGKKSVSDNLYIPKKIKITYPKLTFNFESDVIGIGQILMWNTDLESQKPIIIKTDYSPFDNKNEIASQAPKSISHAKAVEDKGSFQLSMDLFSGIPKNSIITVSIERNNFKVIKNSDDATAYLIYAQSILNFSCTYK